jgi:phosphatidylserine decarboxylase
MNGSRESLGARLFIALQYLLPQHLLSKLVGALARSRRAWIRRPLLSFFIRTYRPEMDDALNADPHSYASFNEFFTRALKPGARPLASVPHAITSPVDGRISALGVSGDGRLLQAKGRDYGLQALLAGDQRLTDLVQGGPYLTIYLAPYNYHRIHMAMAGRLRNVWFVPGRLFSVNDVTARNVEGLFARNERLILEFDGDQGPHIQVLVGALFVGSMGTVWHGDITPPPQRTPVQLPLPATAATLCAQGAELGRFNMGSTVILLLPPGGARWQDLQAGQTLRVGQRLGELPSGKAAL